MSYQIDIHTTNQSRLNELDFANIPFGKVFSDHMFIADYRDGKWQNCRIEPYGRLSISPAMSGLHYGQEIFEGMKAFKDQEGNPQLFRPEMNVNRFNRSAKRMAMPDVPDELFLEAMKKLVALDKDWVPTGEESALYIRPFMFATDEYIGVQPSNTFKFIIFTCPVGAYYTKPVSVMVSEEYVRAFPGGVGDSKVAGNYGAAMMPYTVAKEHRYNQMLWMDGYEFKYVQEIGTMNVFFQIGDTFVTPSLDEKTILEGVTRDSVIELLRDKGYNVETRRVSIDEVLEAHQQGKLKDAFGTGTAATITHIVTIGYRGTDYELPPVEERDVSTRLKQDLQNIRTSKVSDSYNWVHKIQEEPLAVNK